MQENPEVVALKLRNLLLLFDLRSSVSISPFVSVKSRVKAFVGPEKVIEKSKNNLCMLISLKNIMVNG
jgi:hypothetical protein